MSSKLIVHNFRDDDDQEPLSEGCVFDGRKVREIRNKKGLTLQSVADGIGRDKGTLSLVERNEVVPNANIVSALSWHLEVPVRFFFTDKCLS